MNKIKTLLTMGLSALALSAMASPIYIVPSRAVTSPIEVKTATQVGGTAPVVKDAAQGDDGSASGTLQPAGTKNDYDGLESATSRLLPTVNKKTGESSERVLPTVNKREADITAKGWDVAVQATMEQRAKEITDADENIASAEISKDEVRVVYNRPMKLFGFIPMAYWHAFTVDGKGNISSGNPWWLKLFATSDATQFGSDVVSTFQREQAALRYIKAPTTEEQQTQRFSSLSNILKTKHDTAKNSINNIR